MGKILLLGATAGTGFQLAQKLLHQGNDIRIIARNREKALRLFGHTKAEIVIADLTQPGPDFFQAFENVDHIFFTAAVPPGFASEEKIKQVDYGGVLVSLEAAKKAGFNGRFYYMNTIGLYHRSFFISLLNRIKKNLVHWRIETEKLILAGGIPYTIVRAGILKNTPSGTKPVQVLAEDIPITLRTSISRADVADVFIACMNEEQTRNKTISVIWKNGAGAVAEQLKKR